MPAPVKLEVTASVKKRALGIDFGTDTKKTTVTIPAEGVVLFDKNGIKVFVKQVS